MKKVRMVAAACAVAGGAMLVPAAPASAASKCSGKGAKGVVSSATARVFTLPSGQERKVYACLYSQNKKRFLGWVNECQDETAASGFVLSGPYVGYVETNCGLVASHDTVVVRDIKTNKVRYSAPGATGNEAEGEEDSSSVTDLAMSQTGSVVWIGAYDANSGGMNGAGDTRQVKMLYPGSPKDGELVDFGLGIEEGTLALGPRGSSSFNWFYYRHLAEAKSGQLK